MGKPKLTCLADGSWDHATPECLPQDPESNIVIEAGPPVRPVISSQPSSSSTENPIPKRRTPPFRRKPVQRDPDEEELGRIFLISCFFFPLVSIFFETR